MINGSKIDLIKAITLWRLSQAISHMKDKTDLEQRVNLLTVNLKRNADPFLVASGCYEAILRHQNLGKKGKIPQLRLPGLIWSIDASGGRRGHIADMKDHPHIHAIFIHPSKMAVHDFDISASSIEDRLGKLPGVAAWNGASLPVHLKPFSVKVENEDRTVYEQLLDFCSYALKGELALSRSHQHSANYRTSGVFPFDSFTNHTRGNLASEVNEINSNLNDGKRRFRHIGRL